MEFSSHFKGQEQPITALFQASFTVSEGAAEGAIIGELAHRLLTNTSTSDLHVFTASNGVQPLGAIIFSRLKFTNDRRAVFVLGPVAVSPHHQRKGIGQKLINHGLDALRQSGVDVALTYGDPNYYSRMGFKPISEADIQAPFKLQFPAGWLGQSLTGIDLTPFNGPPRCVDAFNEPRYW